MIRTHLFLPVDLLSHRLSWRPTPCSGCGSEQHSLRSPGWDTMALLQRPFIAFKGSAPTIQLAVAASGRTCSSGPHLSCLPWVTILSEIFFMGFARLNEPHLILCSVKGCLSHRLLSESTCVFLFLHSPSFWWCLMLLIVLVCFLEARISNISLNFPFDPETGNIQNLPDCTPSWGWQPQWGNVWEVTGVSWRWMKVDVHCAPHMILNHLCSDRFKFLSAC